MKRYEGFSATKSGRRKDLEPGGYVVKIMKAEDVHFQNGDCLMVSFEIAEGEKAGFFTEDYRNNTFDNKKWRGVHYLNQPQGDGSERDGWSVNAMNNFIAVLQESNPGFVWNWEPVERGDYAQLKGKLLGVLMGKVQWSYNGKTGWNTKCRAVIPAQDVRNGEFEIPADKPLAENRRTDAAVDSFTEELLDSDDDLPF